MRTFTRFLLALLAMLNFAYVLTFGAVFLASPAADLAGQLLLHVSAIVGLSVLMVLVDEVAK